MIKIGQKPAPIESPIEHLSACHRRIEERLATLERTADLLGSEEGSRKEEARQAITSALRFLDSSGAMHTVDEETSMFPRLMPKLDVAERDYVESLERQHREVDEAYAELKAAFADCYGGMAEVARYRAAAARVARIYREHIASEDQVLTAMARRCFSAADLAEIAAEMRARRGNRAGQNG